MRLSQLRKLFLMLALACLVGVLASLATLLFKAFIAVFHNLFFLGQFKFIYDETLHTPSSLWGIGIIFVPVIGGIIVIWLIEHFAHNEKGLSIPDIMYNIHHQEGKISATVALAKTLAAVISIASGASIGREGPVVQISAAISSVLSDWIRLSVEQRKLLIAGGVAAGTAAIFNAPFAGMLFAIELFVVSLNEFSIIFIMIAAIVATFVEHCFIGDAPIFAITLSFSSIDYFHFFAYLAASIILGIIIGLTSILFIHGIYWVEDYLSCLKNPYIGHSLAMFMIGIMMFILMKLYNHYYIEGVGFATVQDCLSMLLTDPWLLLLLFVCKLIATCLSLGSGASGGVFSPTLFLGATLGALYGIILHALFPSLTMNPILFTLMGMAGFVASTTGAVITAIALIFEMTRNLFSLWPMLITCFVAYFLRRQLCRESVYTLKLVRKGMQL